MSDTPDPLALVEEMESRISKWTSAGAHRTFAVSDVRSLCDAVRAARKDTPNNIDAVLYELEEAMHACTDQPFSVDSMTLIRTWRATLEEAFARAASPIGPETP